MWLPQTEPARDKRLATPRDRVQGATICSGTVLLGFLNLLLSTIMLTTISIPSPADFHVHLRQGELSELVTPHVRKGGFHLAYVMVHLMPSALVTL